MTNWYKLVGITLLTALLSGCLTIRESFTFKRNGSGTMSYSVVFDNIDEAFSRTQGDLLPDTWSFESMADAISRVSGISNIELTEEDHDRGFGITFDFDNLTSLNHAMSRMLLADTTEVFPYFRREHELWIRTHKADKIQLTEAFISKSRSENQVAALLNQLSYEVNMEFKRPIAVVYSETAGQISGRKARHFRSSVPLSVISQSPDALNATILLD